MDASAQQRAVAAARSLASSFGLTADDAVVLHDSNKLTLRLLPADLVARVAPDTEQVAGFEVDLAQRLAAVGCPVAALDPRVAPAVHERDGFVITLWTYYPTVPGELAAADYAEALRRLHAGMRLVDAPTPQVTDRVDSALELVASPDRTPAMSEADRVLLRDTLEDLRRVVAESGGPQLLHGEPHPGNVLHTASGPLFVDLETCCRGPVEFDLAHAPDEVAAHYPGVNQDLLRACRTLMLAMITTWRWDRDDRFPNGAALGVEWLADLRVRLRPEWPAPSSTRPRPS